MQEQKDFSQKQSIRVQEDLKILFSQTQKFKCIKNNKALNVCAQKQCTKHGFVCGQQQCQCKNIHQDCKTKYLKKIINTLLNKKMEISKQIKQIYDKLYKEINQLIDQLSKLREKIELEQEYFGLSKEDLKLIDIVKQNKLQQINGKIIFQMQKSKNQNNKNANLFVQYYQFISSFIKTSKIQVIQMMNQDHQNYLKKQTNEKYIVFDPQNKKIYKENNIWKLTQNKSWEAYKFIPLTVNKNTLNFNNGAFKMSSQKAFEKAGTSNWCQATSNQSLPSTGKYYFQVNCINLQSSYTLIGILSSNCLQNTYSHAGGNGESMCYFFGDGHLYSNGKFQRLGKILENKKGLISVLINMDNKTIHWCIDSEYQGKANIKQSLLNKKIYAEVQVYSQSDKHQFIS